jgi:hypothetical protein
VFIELSTMSSTPGPTTSLGPLKFGAICAGCFFVLAVLALVYVGGEATVWPDVEHTHRHVHKGRATYLTDEQELIDSIATYVALGSFLSFAMFNAAYSRIKDREQQRALEEQSLRDDRDPRNIV